MFGFCTVTTTAVKLILPKGWFSNDVYVKLIFGWCFVVAVSNSSTWLELILSCISIDVKNGSWMMGFCDIYI